jgi:HK97 family phage major capsid protein
LRARQEDLLARSTAVIDQAEAENHRDLSVEEGTQIDELTAEFERVGNEIARRERINAQNELLTVGQGRRTDSDEEAADPTPVNNRREASPVQNNNNNAQLPGRFGPVHAQARIPQSNWGFRNFGDFALSVKAANPRFGGELDQRLVRNAAATTYSQEAVGADGGFAVPPDFRNEIMGKVFSEDSLISRTDRLTSSSNTITMPVDNTSPWQTTGGVQGFWIGEAQTKTQSKIVLEQVTVKLSQLACLVPVTEELLEDAPALDGYLRRKVPEKLDFKLSYALAWGTGSGQPLGFMNSPALVTQAAEGGQAVDTVKAENLLKMLSRLPVSSRRSAVWLIHPDVEPQLPLMLVGTQPVYMPTGGLSGSMYGTLFGRPVIPHQVCETVGDLGDVMLVDFNQYMSIVKTGGGRDATGLRTDVSIHLWFDQDIVAYRFTLRVGGLPWWSSSVASRDGSLTMSPYVTLASR